MVWLLAGCLPLQALLYLCILSLFGMITRLHGGKNVLADHARHILSTAKPSSKSWFLEVQKIWLQYLLPHPITFLDNPPTKYSFKRQVKSAFIDYWEQTLRGQALSSFKVYSNHNVISLENYKWLLGRIKLSWVKLSWHAPNQNFWKEAKAYTKSASQDHFMVRIGQFFLDLKTTDTLECTARFEVNLTYGSRGITICPQPPGRIRVYALLIARIKST